MTKEETADMHVVAPGATIGILGNGQLGRMMAIEAKHMGYRVHVFSPSHDSPAGQVADLEVVADYDDLGAVEKFAEGCDVVTLEFENIPVASLETAGKHVAVLPGIKALQTTQHRRLEKEFLRDIGVPTCEFQIVRSLDELKAAAQQIMPAVIKTTTMGYDGKGQAVIRTSDDIQEAWESLKTAEAILEAFVDYDFEFSIVAARNPAGLFAAYPSIRNEHHEQILDVSFTPSGLSEAVNLEAKKVAFRIADQLDIVGVFCVEFFYRDGEILVNEIAPRPHNSGHLTIEGHTTNQFEQHIRAVCGLMLGSSRILTPVAMANLLGDQWKEGTPRWELGLSMPNVKLRLYGKTTPKEKRKMGHLTATSHSAESAVDHVLAARKLLQFGRRPQREGVMV